MSFGAKIVGKEALTQVTPAAVRAYALAHGWRFAGRYREHSDIYRFPDSDDEAIIPATDRIVDFAKVISELIGLFAKVEDRDELQVYRDLSTADTDVIRIRAPQSENDGTIRIESGVDLVLNARELLLSAACSASEPRRAYRAGRVRAAADYMRNVRLGQTERGSFVVTLLSPVPPALTNTEQTAFWPELSEDPFERQVTRRLVQGLEAARDAVQSSNRGEGLEAFENAVEKGVSANLCDAAAKLIRGGVGLDVRLTWAQTRPAPEVQRRVQFSVSDAQTLSEAARLFKEREPRQDERLEGYVIKCTRAENERDGRATLRTLVDNQQVSVTVQLSQVLYERAVVAHRDQLAVAISGDLEREGHRWHLYNPRDLRVLPAAEDEPDS